MRKKLFAILMSAMMMVTFMPSMAFAGSVKADTTDTGLYQWTDDAGDDHTGKLVEKVAATCISQGYKLYECTTCGDTYLEKLEKTPDTHAGTIQKMSPEAYIEARINYYATWKAEYDAINDPVQGKATQLATQTAENLADLLVADDAREAFEVVKTEILELLGELDVRVEGTIARDTVDYYLGFYPEKVREIVNKIVVKYLDEEYLNTYCYVFASVCPDCGLVELDERVEHNPGKKVAACASSFACKECKKTIVSKADNSDNLLAVAKILSDVEEEVKSGKPFDDKATAIVDKLANAAFFLDGSTVHTGTWAKETAACGASVYSMTCTKCGEKVFKNVRIVNKSTNHNLETVTVLKPTCVTPGLEVQRCKDCGALTLKGITVLKAKGHNKTAVTVAPTCGGIGYTVNKCADCGLVLGAIKSIKKPAGHKYKVETVHAATCTSPGLVKISCENCTKKTYYYNGEENENPYVVESMESLKDAISWDMFVDYDDVVKVTTKRAHELDGEDVVDDSTSKYYYTGFGVLGLADGLTQKVEIPSTKAGTGHKWLGWEKVLDATCTHKEVWVQKCAVCDRLDVHQIAYTATGAFDEANSGHIKLVGAVKDHNIVTKVVPATCGTAGYSYKICADCGKFFNEYDVAVKETPGQKTIDVIAYDVTVDASGNATVTPKPGTMTVDTVSATLLDNAKFNKVNPIVEAGAKCTFNADFTLVKARTIFEAGCQAHTCSVCGAIGPDLHELNKLTYTAPAVTAGSKKATVKVENKKDAVQYTIQVRPYGKANAGKWQNVKTVKKGGKVTVKKTLKSGKKFNFRICATRADGKKAYSKVTKGVKIK